MPESEIKLYECTACDAIFLDRSDLRKHIYDDHFDDREKADSVSRSRMSRPAAAAAHTAAVDGAMSHKVVRNKEGKCAVVPAAAILPPGWTKKYGANTKRKCDAFKAHACQAQNHCNA